MDKFLPYLVKRNNFRIYFLLANFSSLLPLNIEPLPIDKK